MEILIWIIIVVLAIYALYAIVYRQTEYYDVTHRPYYQVFFDKGNTGEYEIYRKLRTYEKDGAKFLFNCYLPKDSGETTEIDVLMIHKSGIYVFESKNYSGWIFGDEYNRTWTQTLPNGRKVRKEHFLNPIMQNQLHIKWLEKQIGENIPIYSVIVFSERCTLKKISVTSSEIKVIKRNDILSTVKQMVMVSGNCIPDVQMTDIYEKLYPFTQVSEEEKRKHVEVIKNKYNEGFGNNINMMICPKCNSELVLRTAKKGRNAGKQFYGCSKYPNCRYFRDIER